MTTSKTLLGILAGIATGTVIGMLLAPAKSSRLRKIISRESDDLADAINDKINERFEELLKNISGKIKKATAREEASSDKPEA